MARIAGAHEFIAELADDMILLLEKRSRLSVGRNSGLPLPGIACNPKILIFDATSALIMSRKVLLKEFEGYLQRKNGFDYCTPPSTLRDADAVMVVEKVRLQNMDQSRN